MIDRIKFWWFRVRVSAYGSWKFKRLGLWGFCDEECDRDGFESYTVADYFQEAWCRD